MLNYDLSGRVAIVTGASEGLGVELATTLSEYGATVAIAARNMEKLQKTAQEISEKTGNKVVPYQVDVSQEKEIIDFVARVVKELGSIDILVNNAGAITYGMPEEITLEEWNRVLAVDYTAPFLMMREVGKAWMIEHGGRIVNISSVSGLRASKYSCSYTSVKAAVINMTQSVAASWAQYGIYVNSIAPGSMSYGGMNKTQTDEIRKSIAEKVPQQRVGMYGDLSGALMFLASDANTYCQGQTIVCDGGLILCSH